MRPNREDLERLRAQEEWGKWNTAPLANRIYGKPHWIWDFAVLAASVAILALKLYAIWSMFQ